jgi:hypothetical protein
MGQDSCLSRLIRHPRPRGPDVIGLLLINFVEDSGDDVLECNVTYQQANTHALCLESFDSSQPEIFTPEKIDEVGHMRWLLELVRMTKSKQMGIAQFSM